MVLESNQQVGHNCNVTYNYKVWRARDTHDADRLNSEILTVSAKKYHYQQLRETSVSQAKAYDKKSHFLRINLLSLLHF